MEGGYGLNNPIKVLVIANAARRDGLLLQENHREKLQLKTFPGTHVVNKIGLGFGCGYWMTLWIFVLKD